MLNFLTSKLLEVADYLFCGEFVLIGHKFQNIDQFLCQRWLYRPFIDHFLLQILFIDHFLVTMGTIPSVRKNGTGFFTPLKCKKCTLLLSRSNSPSLKAFKTCRLTFDSSFIKSEALILLCYIYNITF